MWAELDDDIGGEDEIRVFMGFDHGGFTADPAPILSVDLIFDEPDTEYLTGYSNLTGYYVDQVWPTLWEFDEDELIAPWEPNQPFTGIPTLDTILKVSGEEAVLLADGMNPDDADYNYHFVYKRCRLKADCKQ